MGKRRLSIMSVLLFGSAGMTFIAVALALYLGLSSAIENTRALLHQRADRMIDDLRNDISKELDPVRRHAIEISKRVLSGDFDPSDAAKWRSVVSELPSALPQVTGIAFIGTDMQGRIYSSIDDDVFPRDFAMLPRATQLLETTRGRHEPQWLRPLWSPILGRVIIALALPLYHEDRLVGIHVAVIALADFSARVSQRMQGSGLTPFIIYDNSWLMVHPAIADWKPSAEMVSGDLTFGRSEYTAFLPDLESMSGEKISHFWEAKRIAILGDAVENETRVSQFARDGEREVFVYRDIKDFGDRSWIVGAHFDGNVALAEIQRLQNYLLLSLAVLVLAVLATAAVGSLTSKPIRRLAAAAHAARGEDLAAVPSLSGSLIRELDEASAAFNEMIVGLKERARIRNLFGKYLPESIATQLLSQETGLAPQSAEATVLFVDLEKFTALSETLKPEQVVELLNSYFSTAVEIIERYNGVVTQFQGDAILAIFNVPISDPEHAPNAVAAGMELLAAVSHNRFAGHQLGIRIGINTGDVFAGNVGAQDRLSYTVHGDAVNIAARLEAMNKELGTRILIGENTASRLTVGSLKKIPDVTIRGKVATVGVYTVDGGD